MQVTVNEVQDQRTEREDARSFWASTDYQGREYGPNAPLYIDRLADLVAELLFEAPDEAQSPTVFEFGCNAGRNLALIQARAPGEVRAQGCDVNAASVEHGRAHFQLPLAVGDETHLDSLDAESQQVVFTVSVLDHIPKIDTTLERLSRVCGRYLLLLEPHLEDAGKVEAVRSEFKERFSPQTKPQAGTAPYSYGHEYNAELLGLPLVERMQTALPPYLLSLGPTYRLRVLEKGTQAWVHLAQSRLSPSAPIEGPLSAEACARVRMLMKTAKGASTGRLVFALGAEVCSEARKEDLLVLDAAQVLARPSLDPERHWIRDGHLWIGAPQQWGLRPSAQTESLRQQAQWARRAQNMLRRVVLTSLARERTQKEAYEKLKAQLLQRSELQKRTEGELQTLKKSRAVRALKRLGRAARAARGMIPV